MVMSLGANEARSKQGQCVKLVGHQFSAFRGCFADVLASLDVLLLIWFLGICLRCSVRPFGLLMPPKNIL